MSIIRDLTIKIQKYLYDQYQGKLKIIASGSSVFYQQMLPDVYQQFFP